MLNSYYRTFLNEEIQWGGVIEKENFLYLPDTQIKIRNRNNATYNKYCGNIYVWKIPPEEIHLIATYIIENYKIINEKDLIKLISKEIGFGRMTTNIHDAILEVLEPLKNNHKIKYENRNYSYQ